MSGHPVVVYEFKDGLILLHSIHGRQFIGGDKATMHLVYQNGNHYMPAIPSSHRWALNRVQSTVPYLPIELNDSSELGMYLFPVPGDGSCLFHSLTLLHIAYGNSNFMMF